MAAITIQRQINGPRNILLLIQLTGDAGADLLNYPIADILDFDDGTNRLSIKAYQYEFKDFTAELTWGGSQPVDALTLTDQSSTFQKPIAAIVQHRVNSDGKLLLSTKGLTSGKYGTLMLHLRKRRNAAE